MTFNENKIIIKQKHKGECKMKYFGKKSLSSFFSIALHIAWYVVLIMSILGVLFGTIFILISHCEELPLTETELEECQMAYAELEMEAEDWETFKEIPLIVKFLFLPYFVVVVVILLKILKKARSLFNNFKDGIVFNQNNVQLIAKIGKLLIIFSIMTVDFATLLVSIFLLMICEIFKTGTALQEEQDLTI